MKLKKHFGQHFLTDEKICMDIVNAVTHEPEENQLLEIGPGAGAISKYLAEKDWKEYRLVEIDEEKVAYLIHQLGLDSLQIIHDDVLNISPPFLNGFIIIGNFPYNISTQIMFKILEWKEQVREVVGMFQKEVAVRIASKEGNKDYGILSVLMQTFFDVEYLFDVPPVAFNPPPKVMSGVIRLHSNDNKYQISRPEKLQSLVKSAFAMRRKTMRNNMKGRLSAEVLSEDRFSLRAEQWSVADYIQLYKELYEQ